MAAKRKEKESAAARRRREIAEFDSGTDIVRDAHGRRVKRKRASMARGEGANADPKTAPSPQIYQVWSEKRAASRGKARK